MTKPERVKKKDENPEDIPEVAPAEQQQVAVHESMDIDPRTGARIRVGVPDRSDEELVQDFIAWLQERAEADNTDSMAMLAEEIRRADSATTLADVFKEKPKTSGKMYVGHPFMAHKIAYHEGDFEESDVPFFASIHATNGEFPDGFIINCGALKTLVHLRSIERFNALPIPLVITGAQTRKGYTVLSFALVKQTPQ